MRARSTRRSPVAVFFRNSGLATHGAGLPESSQNCMRDSPEGYANDSPVTSDRGRDPHK